MKLAFIFDVSFGKERSIPVTSCKTGIVKSTAVKRAYVTAFRLPPRSASLSLKVVSYEDDKDGHHYLRDLPQQLSDYPVPSSVS